MRIKLNNVGVIEKCDVEFIPGINLIVGSSGSGKSTLMRSIYGMALNEFSDSDISFGKNTMNITICCNGNTIEYVRSIHSRGDKFFYKVNNEVYNKIGRTALPQVAEVLKIGDVEVNGESINFNFNLQFSTPFLILGSQSTLYNVLTYRSSFDISSINDFYSADVKNNANELATTVKVKERLEENLENLESQSSLLSPIESIYSNYISCKHKSQIIDELKSQLEKKHLFNTYCDNLDSLNYIIEKVDKAITLLLKLKEVSKYAVLCNNNKEISNEIKKYNKLISHYESAMNVIQSLTDISNMSKLVTTKEIISYNIDLIDKCIKSYNKIANNESLFVDVTKQLSLLNKFNKCTNAISKIGDAGKTTLDLLDDFFIVRDKLKSTDNLDTSLVSINKECESIHKKLSKFSVCPLCGGTLHNE